MKTLLALFTLLFGVVGYGAVPLGLVPYAQLDTNDFGVTAVGHVNTRLSIHTPNTPGDTYYLTINGTNINNGGTNFLQSLNPTAWTLPVRGADTNFVDSLLRQDATGLHAGTNLFDLTGALGEPSFTMGDLGSTTNISIWAQGMILAHDANTFRVQETDVNTAGIEWSGSIWELVTRFGNVQLKDNFPANTAHWQPTFPASSQKTWLGSSTNWWDGIYAGSSKLFQFFDVVIDPGVSTNLNFAVDGVTYNIGAGGGSVGGTTINSLDNYIPVRLNAGAFDNSPLYTTGGNIATDGAFVWGPGDTNKLSRSSGGTLRYTNGYPIFQLVGIPGSIQIESASAYPGIVSDRTLNVLGAHYGFTIDENLKAVYPPNAAVGETFGYNTNYYGGLLLGTNSLMGWLTGDDTQVYYKGVPLGLSSVTYAAVTNALLATGSASDVFHGDGSWGAGGGGGEWTLTNFMGTVTYLLPSTNSIGYYDFTGTLGWFVGTNAGLAGYISQMADGVALVRATADSTSISGISVSTDGTVAQLKLDDGTDTLVLESDSALVDLGTGLWLNGDSITPFIRTGTDITTRTAGDSVTLTGTLTVTNAAPLTTPALEVFGGMRISRYETAVNYAISITNHMVTATADCTLTLPSAAAVGNGFMLILKAKSTVSTGVTVTPDGSDTIDGASGNATFDPLTSYIIVSDGVSDWEIIAFRIAI